VLFLTSERLENKSPISVVAPPLFNKLRLAYLRSCRSVGLTIGFDSHLMSVVADS